MEAAILDSLAPAPRCGECWGRCLTVFLLARPEMVYYACAGDGGAPCRWAAPAHYGVLLLALIRPTARWECGRGHRNSLYVAGLGADRQTLDLACCWTGLRFERRKLVGAGRQCDWTQRSGIFIGANSMVPLPTRNRLLLAAAAGAFLDVDTSAFVVGDKVYLDDEVAGGLTVSPPGAGARRIPIGVIVVADADAGRVLVTNAPFRA